MRMLCSNSVFPFHVRVKPLCSVPTVTQCPRAGDILPGVHSPSPAGVALLALAQDGIRQRGRRRSEAEGVVGKGLQGRAAVRLHGCKTLQFLRHRFYG